MSVKRREQFLLWAWYGKWRTSDPASGLRLLNWNFWRGLGSNVKGRHCEFCWQMNTLFPQTAAVRVLQCANKTLTRELQLKQQQLVTICWDVTLQVPRIFQTMGCRTWLYRKHVTYAHGYTARQMKIHKGKIGFFQGSCHRRVRSLRICVSCMWAVVKDNNPHLQSKQWCK